MSRPVTWDGREFPSIAAAARYEGVSSTTMLQWLGLEPQPAWPDEVTIRGVTYPTVDAAAKAFNVQRAAIVGARRIGRLDHVGLPGGRRRKA